MLEIACISGCGLGASELATDDLKAFDAAMWGCAVDPYKVSGLLRAALQSFPDPSVRLAIRQHLTKKYGTGDSSCMMAINDAFEDPNAGQKTLALQIGAAVLGVLVVGGGAVLYLRHRRR